MSRYPLVIKVYESIDGWRWRLVARNGFIVADSGQAYSQRCRAMRAAGALMRSPIEFEAADA